MKIQSFTMTGPEFPNGYTVEFDNVDTQGPSIHYLVGPNGSGKTNILDYMYTSLSGTGNDKFSNDARHVDMQISKLEGICSWGIDIYNHYSPLKHNGNIFQIEYSLVYSTTEVNFASPRISSITATPTDKENTKEKSTDLHIKIPQLLVDISNQDGVIAAKFHSDNIGKTIKMPTDIDGQKLHRFISTYNKIFAPKKWGGIDRSSGQFDIYFTDRDGSKISLKDLSSGEKQVIYRLGYILKDIDVVKGGIILIDEPEISLHPAWQIKFREILLDMFENVDVQIIIATHSPYILTNIDPTKEECILVDRTKKSTEQLKIRGASPSMNLVNYIAFGIPSKELHIELYDRMIQAGILKDNQKNDTKTLKESHNQETLSFKRTENYPKDRKTSNIGYTVYEPLTMYVRNGIHHPSETNRDIDTYLKDSIRSMLTILRDYTI